MLVTRNKQLMDNNNNNITFSLEKSINDKGDLEKSYYNFLKFPKYDRVILSNSTQVVSWRISNGEFEKRIFTLKTWAILKSSVRMYEYGNSEEYFIVHKRVFEKRNVKSVGPGIVSIYSSKTLEQERYFETENYYINRMKFLPMFGKDCFLCAGIKYCLTNEYIYSRTRGIIYVISFLTGKIIKGIEEQKTNGSNVFLSKTIPNSFYYNAYNSGMSDHPIQLMNYEEEIKVKKNFMIPDFMWRVVPFLNSKSHECCLASGSSLKMYIFNTLLESKIHSIEIALTRPRIFDLLNDQYLIIGKNFSLECFSVKFLEDSLCKNENYVPETVFKKIIAHESQEKKAGKEQYSISKLRFEIDENDGSFVNFNILINDGHCMIFRVAGLKLEGILGMAKKDKLERIFYLRNEEFKDLYCKKDPIFVIIKLYNAVLENVLKNLVLK